MAWTIELSDSARKELSALDRPVAQRIRRFLSERVSPLEDPRSIGEALRGDRLGTFWKYRVGDWRIIADIEDKMVRILVVRIANRRSAYRKSGA